MRGECENCEYETELTEYPNATRTETNYFCEVCAHTFLSRATTYPTHVPDVMLYKSIGWIANRILDEVRGGKAGTLAPKREEQ